VISLRMTQLMFLKATLTATTTHLSHNRLNGFAVSLAQVFLYAWIDLRNDVNMIGSKDVH